MATSHNFYHLLLLLLTVLFLLGKPVIATNRCTDECGGVQIQFPFYLKNTKLNHNTGYGFPSGFDLSCTDEDVTVLELQLRAVLLKLFVKRIDYKSQQIEIYDPKNCLSSQLLAVGNSSVSPFQFQSYGPRNVSFFRCTSNKACPILQRDSGGDFIDPEIVSCTKVSDVLSVGWDISDDRGTESVIMEWSKPNCSFCEAKGQKCKWKNGTHGETECFVCPSNRLPKSTVLLITAGT